MRLVKAVLFIIAVAIAVIVAYTMIVTLLSLVEYLLKWLGVSNVGQPFRIDDIYSIMGE